MKETLLTFEKEIEKVVSDFDRSVAESIVKVFTILLKLGLQGKKNVSASDFYSFNN